MIHTKWLRLGLILTLFVGAVACDNDKPLDTPGPAPAKGDADFTKYVAIGNSLTAGFADGGLYRESQLNSYPSILALQFRTVGGGDFIQPLFPTEQANGTGYLKLTSLPVGLNPLPGLAQVAPQSVRSAANGRLLYTKFTGANQNLGVPGIKMVNVLQAGYGTAQGNPYLERLLPDNTPLTRTYLDYVSNNLAGATFFTSWLGNNDVLGFATSGGAEPLSDPGVFSANYTALLNKLTENGRKGVIIGIPPVTSAPYFTTVNLTLLLLQVNALLKQQNPNAPTANALVIQTATGPRATQPGDLLLLSQVTEYSKIGSTSAGTQQGPFGLSPTNPLPNQLVLDASEVTALNARSAELNAILKQQAEAKGLAYADISSLINQLGQSGGLKVGNAAAYSLAYITGGIFGLDGVHLTPAGYALAANEIIKAINSKYRSTIPPTDVNSYRRVLLQQ